ncbi:3-isopropylmalate dehydrogenase, partial [Desulfovibrio sp. OttesenSCG-928-C14]|nr:3-isopropylmalate dehydrogenase [Desulfovibrio sp. OttesenSCG-928-C14]
IMEFRIAVIPGDGIGVDVVREGVRALDKVALEFGHTFNYEHRLVGGCCVDAHGVPIQEETLEICRDCGAILFGAAGGPKWDHLPREQKPESGLARLRREFNLFANLRPSKIYEDLKENSPLKNRVIEKGVDIMLIRDLVGGIYFNEKGRRQGKYGLEGYDVECYSVFEVTRVAKKAFEIAMLRGKKVTSVDKANALEASKIWRETVTEVARDYPEVELKHMLVDKAAMELACNPSVFDVILTTSIFGDILSDEAGVTTGSVGMLASAALNEHGFGLFEPIHGTAPDIAGKGIANPLATVASVAMLLEIGLGLTEEARAVDRAINQVLHDGYRTSDIYTEGTTKVTTEEMGELTAERIKK